MKYFAPVGGVFFLSLIGLMFYWLYWDEAAEKEIAEVKMQLTVLERFWNERSGVRDGKLTIAYGDISASGFPFGLRVRLLKPMLRDTRGDYVFALTMNYMDIVPEESDGSLYRLEYPADAHAIVKRTAGQPEVYYLHLSHAPELKAQKINVGDRSPPAVNQYGVMYPPQLLLTADFNGKTQRYPLKLIDSDELMWRPVFANLRERTGYLKSLLEAGR